MNDIVLISQNLFYLLFLKAFFTNIEHVQKINWVFNFSLLLIPLFLLIIVAIVKNQKAVAASQSASMKATNITGYLEQNTPNPFNSITTIRYNVPSSVNRAQIMVTNAAGSTVKAFTLNGKGAGTVTINANELNAGSYFYTLIIDGKKVDRKQMVLEIN